MIIFVFVQHTKHPLKCENFGTYVGSLLKKIHHAFFTSYNEIKVIRESIENCTCVKCANEIILVFNLVSER